MTKATLIVGFVRNRLKQSWLLDIYRERDCEKSIKSVVVAAKDKNNGHFFHNMSVGGDECCKTISLKVGV